MIFFENTGKKKKISLIENNVSTCQTNINLMIDWLYGVYCCFHCYFSYFAMANTPIHAFLKFFQPVLHTLFIPSNWLLPQIFIVKIMDGIEREIDPIAMAIINPQTEYQHSRKFKLATSCSKVFRPTEWAMGVWQYHTNEALLIIYISSGSYPLTVLMTQGQDNIEGAFSWRDSSPSPFPTQFWLLITREISLLKTLWEKGEVQVASIFTFIANVFYPIKHRSTRKKKKMVPSNKFCSNNNSFKWCLNPFPNKPWFLRVCSTSLLKTLWQKEKLLVTSNFSYSRSVFHQFQEFSAILIESEINVCKLFQFGTV